MIRHYLYTTFILSVLGISLILATGSIQLDTNKVFAQPPPSEQTSANETNPMVKAGPLTAVRHVYDDPTVRVWHFCTPHHSIMAVCTLFDTNQTNASLIGIEYMITPEHYNQLPEREKPYWHHHVTEFAPDRADPHFPILTAEEEKKMLKMVENSYGKVIITWNPNDKLPAFPPQIQIVQHSDMVNKTTIPETTIGSFNQTLNY